MLLWLRQDGSPKILYNINKIYREDCEYLQTLKKMKNFRLLNTLYYRSIFSDKRYRGRTAMKKNKIKRILITAAAIMCMGAAPCFYVSAEADTQTEQFSIDDCISESDCIIYADYKGMSGDKYEFEIIRMIKGSASGRSVYVTASEEFGSEFVTGTNYVLFLDRTNSVYYYHDKYTPVLEIKFIADEQGNITGMTVNGSSVGNLPETVTDLTRYIDLVPSTTAEGKDYIRSSNIDDIIASSPVIVKAKVGKRIGDYEESAGYYECTLVSGIRGNVPDNFSAALFDRKVSEGDEYYLMFSGKDRNGIYILSSKKSVISGDNKGFESRLEEE